MKRATAAEFATAPIGRYVVGRSYIVWCAATDLAGTVNWGVPDPKDVREMMVLMDVVRHPQFAPKGAILMDTRAVERVDPETLLGFVELAREWIPKWSPRIAKQAVLVPSGVTGVLLAGALPLLEPGHEFKFVIEPAAAFAFLTYPGLDDVFAEMDAAGLAARNSTTLIGRLRAVLQRDLAGASVAQAAVALQTSPRTLQRELGELDTSFRDELRKARVAAAAELLKLDAELKTETIAIRLGFGTATRMAAAIRRELGVDPRDLRQKR